MLRKGFVFISAVGLIVVSSLLGIGHPGFALKIVNLLVFPLTLVAFLGLLKNA